MFVKDLSIGTWYIFYFLDCDMSKSEPLEPNTSQSLSESPSDEPGFGWTTYAERINGRFAMVGFLALLLLELLTRQDFFTWLGLP